jgi:hypothetical protein
MDLYKGVEGGRDIGMDGEKETRGADCGDLAVEGEQTPG